MSSQSCIQVHATTNFHLQYLDHVVMGCDAPDVFCSYELRAIDTASTRITSGEPDYRFFLNMSAYLFTYEELFNNTMNLYQFAYGKRTHYSFLF